MDRKMDFSALWGGLRRQVKLVLVVVVLGMGLALLFTYSRAPVYQAMTLVQVEPQAPDLFSGGQGVQNFGINDIRVEGEIEILRSEAVARRVVRIAGLERDPEFGAGGLAGAAGLKRSIGLLQQALRVTRRGQTYLVSVVVRARQPTQAAELSILTAQSYIDNQIEAKISRLEAEADILRDRLEGAQAGLVMTEAAVNEFIGNNPALASGGLVRREVLLLDEEMQRLQGRPNLRGAPVVIDVPSLEDELEQIDAELEAQALARLNGLRGEAAATQSAAVESPELATRLYALQREAEIARGQYDGFLSRLRAVELQAGLQVAGARIVSPALVPIEPSGQSRRLFLAQALVAVLLLGLGLAYMREYIFGGFSSAEQMVDSLGLPVVAEVPQVRPVMADGAGPSAAAVLVALPMGAYSEAIRRLRLALDSAVPPAGCARIFMLASAMPGEGKSNICLALGRVYAASGRRCLLIDCDLRNPQAARIAGLAEGAGWLENPQEALATQVQKDPGSPLDILPGGPWQGGVTDDILAGPGFADLLAAARDVYDVVLLDTPPLHPVVDGLYLARQADAVVVAVKWAATMQRDVRAVLPPLLRAVRPDAPVMFVLNQIRPPSQRIGRKYHKYFA
ncbi:MAG: Wzz/FepE/Etk N-terminal domain-containing protein [Rhodobacteraceae bacterium]|nr:Wzz/FepE/Etk N-terminal domain-containing protein [Paracoccaceae bacterium]